VTDIVCNRCGAAKPEIAYPQTHGKRVGRVCNACRNDHNHHHAQHAPSGRARYAESRRTWHCPGCGLGYPDAFPSTTQTDRPIPKTTACCGCTARDRAERRKKK